MFSPRDKSILNGFTSAASITKKYAKSFYFASHFLPGEKKNAAFSIYSICRIGDNAVDDNQGLGARQKLAQLKKDIDSAYGNIKLDDGLLLSFRETVNKYIIPRQYFDDFIEGIQMDLDKKRYVNFEELNVYCYRVAGSVGFIMLKVFGYKDVRAEKYAVDLGTAMQLTNIIRDIQEDFRQRGRIYLPQDEMKRFGVSEDNISEGRLDENFKDLLRLQIQRARHYYARAEKGIKMLTDLNARVVVYAMKDLYCGILEKIEKNDYDIFSKRHYANKAGKLIIALKILATAKFL
jgi:phytoene synthase